ncbi:hypothetical protein NS44R_14715, partial [Mammaliicoccus sciuri]
LLSAAAVHDLVRQADPGDAALRAVPRATRRGVRAQDDQHGRAARATSGAGGLRSRRLTPNETCGRAGDAPTAPRDRRR